MRKYSQLILLFCKFDNIIKGYTSAKYYTMINRRNTKFQDELIKKQVKKIKSQLKFISLFFFE